MNKTLVESAPAYSTVAKWHDEFSQRWLSCDDLHRSRRSATSVNKEGMTEK